MALALVIGPIIETDLCEEYMGFRPGLDAKLAVRLVYYQVSQKGRQEVVDADLSNYFNTILHGLLMRSLSRRISDGLVLSMLVMWLKALVEERTRREINQRTTEVKRGFVVIPRRWIVERSFVWATRYLRLTRDYERL